MTELRPWVWCLPFFGTRCRSKISLSYFSQWILDTSFHCFKFGKVHLHFCRNWNL